MKLTGQHKQIYDFLKETGEATYREMQDKLFMRKPDMRVSEMNFAYQTQELGIPENEVDLKDETKNIVVTKYTKPNREKVKTLRTLITKQISTFHYDPVAHVMVEVTESVPV